jgi:hypothetical protein
MNVFILPRSEHNFEQRFTMEGSDYLIRWTWNGRSSRWYYRITDVEGTPLTGDRKLVADWSLLKQIHTGNMPPGELWSITADGLDPGLLDLDRDFTLVYVPVDEVANI